MDLRKVETPSFCSAEVVEISIEGHPEQSSGVLLFGNRRLNNYGSRGVTSRKLHFYAGSVLMSTDTYPLEVDWFGVSTDKNPSHLTHNNV
jgi:hypothetical protein